MRSQELRSWCAEHGLHISIRQNKSKCHQQSWPRHTRCKEGNLAYFYDHSGYERLEIMAQFDADHVPEPNYLSSSLPTFLDPQAGYVALPSICGANNSTSWAAQGRLYQEFYMHGPLGASSSRHHMPFCVESRYIVRTAALKEVGGIGPELNEIYSTSYIAIATRDGPVNFEDCMGQEY